MSPRGDREHVKKFLSTSVLNVVKVDMDVNTEVDEERGEIQAVVHWAGDAQDARGRGSPRRHACGGEGARAGVRCRATAPLARLKRMTVLLL